MMKWVEQQQIIRKLSLLFPSLFLSSLPPLSLPPLPLSHCFTLHHLHHIPCRLESNIDSVMEVQQKKQEDIAEDMVNMARSLKQNAKLANKIIKDDNQVHTVSVISVH